MGVYLRVWGEKQWFIHLCAPLLASLRQFPHVSAVCNLTVNPITVYDPVHKDSILSYVSMLDFHYDSNLFLMVQVPNSHILPQNLPWNSYYPSPKYPILWHLDLKGPKYWALGPFGYLSRNQRTQWMSRCKASAPRLHQRRQGLGL